MNAAIKAQATPRANRKFFVKLVKSTLYSVS
jgi:hypothetical protein